MNKTVTINLSGIVFHIDENAYSQLSTYLSSIRNFFSSETESKEIINDIESRIAEILKERMDGKREVVESEDVSSVIEAMGTPEQFGVESEEETSYNTNYASDQASQNTGGKRKRNLMRDPDNKVLSGVSSGLSAYFGIADPIWIRIAWIVITILTSGTTFLVYFILWAIMPLAQTTTDRMAMRGEEMTLKGIKKKVNQLTSDSEVEAKNPNNGVNRFFNFLGELLEGSGKVLLWVFKAFILFLGITLLFSLGAGVFSLIASAIGGGSFASQYIFNGAGSLLLGLLFGLILLTVPMIYIVFGLLRLIFKVQFAKPILHIGLWGLWLISLFGAGIIAGSTANQFSHKGETKTYHQLDYPTSGVLTLKASNDFKETKNGVSIVGPRFEIDTESFYADRDTVMFGNIKLNIKKSKNGILELEETHYSSGPSRKAAHQLASNIAYAFSQQDGEVQFNDLFKVNPRDKFRNQKVELVLRIPEGLPIKFDDSVQEIIYDIKNTTNMYDDDMVGHTWVMGEDGLDCQDCDNFTSHPEKKPGYLVKTFDYTSFNEVLLYGLYTTNIRQGDDYSISISAHKDVINHIEVDKSGSTLEIETDHKFRNFQDRRKRSVEIEITLPELEYLEIAGANDATISGFNQEQMEIDIAGASSCKVNSKVDRFTLSAAGASKINLTGEANVSEIELSGASILSADNFITEKTILELSGASKAHVNAEDVIEGEISGASYLEHSGKAEVDIEKSGAAKIKRKESREEANNKEKQSKRLVSIEKPSFLSVNSNPYSRFFKVLMNSPF